MPEHGDLPQDLPQGGLLTRVIGSWVTTTILPTGAHIHALRLNEMLSLRPLITLRKCPPKIPGPCSRTIAGGVSSSTSIFQMKIW